MMYHCKDHVVEKHVANFGESGANIYMKTTFLVSVFLVSAHVNDIPSLPSLDSPLYPKRRNGPSQHRPHL
jgi:hypothetical protein